ncbi:DUF2905 domain-containing protein [Nitratiruptor sp. YY09-18]|uniref:DUF2905 domain-containing protein n=1 Tax=Nitratiruptor sp. YY09-18 TaxID=2724901 RepID=UPI00193657C4|nr:DUF2905 domain-containing protein [Nitratiruptor sp. YY09-18]BCD68338.1 hypothetical protein NitYY0918_C1249 [Nitratiruptor sp. YY09-18]
MEFGKILVFMGIALIVIGLFISYVGRLPGDIYIKKENFTFYFPITTSIVLSILFSLLLYIFSRFFR